MDTRAAFYDHPIGYPPFMETRGAPTVARPAPADADEPFDAELMTSADVAECTCPDWCARDHDRD